MVSEHASQSAEVSEQAKHNALSGADAVRQTNKAMNAIRERVQEAARAIKRLGESSQEIGNIVQIINDIADRTSILALNASIQAAMAGDAGRGFAVVAEEVQRLAEQSANSTKQIETLVKTIQGEINEAGTRMDDSIQRVVHGTQLADGAHGKLEDIEAVSTQLAELVQAISMAAKEQAISSENISTTMKKLGQVSKQASLQGRHTALSITNLAKTSEQLHQSVEVFTLAQEILEEDEDLEVLEEVA
jgi:twitching motility protein PilJ